MATQRRKILINPRFQLFFLLFMGGMNSLLLGVVFLAQTYFFFEFERMGESLGLPSDHPLFRFLAEQQSTMNQVFGVAAGISIAFSVFFGLIVSHRIAGPIHRLKMHMVRVAMGTTRAEVNFREGDFFPELARAYNLQLKRMKRDLERFALARMEKTSASSKPDTSGSERVA